MGWYDAQVTRLFEPPKDPVILGQQILESGKYPCSGCHALDSLGWSNQTGPNLNGIGDRADDRARAASLPSSTEYMLQSIWQSQAYLVPGSWSNQMPVFNDPSVQNYIPPEEVIAIVAYLCTQTASGNVADNACGLEFDDQGVLADVDATNTSLLELTENYDIDE
jgi:hypothetical protein